MTAALNEQMERSQARISKIQNDYSKLVEGEIRNSLESVCITCSKNMHSWILITQDTEAKNIRGIGSKNKILNTLRTGITSYPTLYDSTVVKITETVDKVADDIVELLQVCASI